MPCNTPYWATAKDGIKYPVPCSSCPDCKKRRVNDWVFRLQKEEERSTTAHFLTLTYKDEFITRTPGRDLPTLVKKDLSGYFKRLRNYQESKIKFYACGEYGTAYKRPHYHAIVFNVESIDHYSKAWRRDDKQIGRVDIGTVTGGSIAYVIKYIDKLSKIPEFDGDDRVPEYATMSNNLGSNFLTPKIREHFTSDLTNTHIYKKGGHKISLPRYYRKHLYTDVQIQNQAIMIGNIMEAERLKKEQFFNQKNKNNDLDFLSEHRRLLYQKFHNYYSSQKKRQ